MPTSCVRRSGSLVTPVVACAIAALLIDLGAVHAFLTSDSIVPVLTSLYWWTPFYWGADRFGQAVALMAVPFTNPLANLLVQSWINFFFGLAVIPVLARCALRESDAMTTGGIAAVLYLALTPAWYQFALSISPYPISMTLIAGGLILVAEERPSWSRWTAAVALVILAHWVNVAGFAYFVPLLLLRTLVIERPPRWRRTAARSVLLLTGAGAGLAFKHAADGPATPLAAQPMSAWPTAWMAMAVNLWRSLDALALGTAFTAALGFGLARTGRLRPRVHLPWREVIAMVGAAAAVFLAVGTPTWVQINGYAGRYAYPAVLFALIGLSALAAAPLRALFEPRVRALAIGLAAALPLSALVSFGLPSPHAVRRAVEGDRDQTEAIISSGATHVAGNYWNVWTAVYRVNLALYERGDNRVIWGLSTRSRPTEALWSKVPRAATRIVALRGDTEVDFWLNEYGYADLRRIGESKTLVVYGVGD